MNRVRHPDRAPACQTELLRLSATPSAQGGRHRLHDAGRSVVDSARNPLAPLPVPTSITWGSSRFFPLGWFMPQEAITVW